MGTIVSRKRKDGTFGHTAQIRLKKDGKVIHTETETFDRKPAAQAWLNKREAELALPGALVKVEDPPLREVIDRYNTEKQKQHGKTKAQVASRKAKPISATDLRGGTCTTSRRANHHQVIHNEAPSKMPGTMPAMKSLEIDTLPATPKMTKPMLGGMTGAMMPAEAIKPAERALS
jgi:hypothetical protein